MKKMSNHLLITCVVFIVTGFSTLYVSATSTTVNGSTLAPTTLHAPWTTTKSKPKVQPKLGKLIFNEHFDTFNTSIWEPIVTMSGCGTREFQMYNKYPENLFVENGILHIQPTLTTDRFGSNFITNGTLNLQGCTDSLYNGCEKTGTSEHIINPVISARIRSKNSFFFKYGKVEVRAKLPLGDWLFPAIWLNPKHQTYGSWPMSGEIDLVESRGNPHLYDSSGEHVGVQQAQSTLHFGADRSGDKYKLAHATKNLRGGFHHEFHNYQMVWTPDFMAFSIDDEEHLRVEPPKGGFYDLGKFEGENIWAKNSTNPKMAPFDQPFYLLLNMAIGGSGGFFSDSFVNSPKPKPWKTGESMDEAMLKFWKAKEDWLPTWKKPDSTFKVDYIKVWTLDTSSPSSSPSFWGAHTLCPPILPVFLFSSILINLVMSIN